MRIGNKEFETGKNTYIVGILNVTYDSFSDGGKYIKVDDAVRVALEMIEQGVDIIDIGGESTRPNHTPIDSIEEKKRVLPVISAIRAVSDIAISIDTSKADVAKAAIALGADMVNDVWGLLKDADMASVIADSGVACCLMHNQNTAEYGDIVFDVMARLSESVAIARKAGIDKSKIILDPGIGFGKSIEDNITIMANLDKFKELGYPMLLGASKKSFLGAITGQDVNGRLEGTLATSVIASINGYSFVRVHDVKSNKLAIMVANRIYQR